MSISVAILGATGVVGQKAIALLADNPNFKIIELVASDARVGKKFNEVCDWREALMPMPSAAAAMELSSADKLRAEYIISCLPSDTAAEVEPMLAAQGKFVFSNASTFRMDVNTPLLVPEINAAHLELLDKQSTSGKIVTNPNCSAVGVTLALAPLKTLSNIEHVSIVTLQSVSGAGYPGVSSLDILGNTIPHIESEADKITEETKKIMGTAIEPAPFAVTTSVNRVPVLYGHTAILHIQFQDAISVADALQTYRDWNQKHPELYVLYGQKGRPQSTKDLHHRDMRVHIGHVNRGDLPNVLSLVALSHNLVRGAAGAAIANMECFLNQHRLAL